MLVGNKSLMLSSPTLYTLEAHPFHTFSQGDTQYFSIEKLGNTEERLVNPLRVQVMNTFVTEKLP